MQIFQGRKFLISDACPTGRNAGILPMGACKPEAGRDLRERSIFLATVNWCGGFYEAGCQPSRPPNETRNR